VDANIVLDVAMAMVSRPFGIKPALLYLGWGLFATLATAADSSLSVSSPATSSTSSSATQTTSTAVATHTVAVGAVRNTSGARLWATLTNS